MNSIDIENFLNRKGVKPTSNRILVAKELMKVSHPVSLADLEILLGFSMDKASIFRVLELFSEKEIVHVIEDGSRSFKYELCYSDTHHCFESDRIPLVNIPEGFYPHAINYMIKGICPNCLK